MTQVKIQCKTWVHGTIVSLYIETNVQHENLNSRLVYNTDFHHFEELVIDLKTCNELDKIEAFACKNTRKRKLNPNREFLKAVKA